MLLYEHGVEYSYSVRRKNFLTTGITMTCSRE